MTKRDMQASEYAAESYGKTYRKRCVSHMSWALTDEERAAILTAADLLIGSRPGATLRSLLERLK